MAAPIDSIPRAIVLQYRALALCIVAFAIATAGTSRAHAQGADSGHSHWDGVPSTRGVLFSNDAMRSTSLAARIEGLRIAREHTERDGKSLQSLNKLRPADGVSVTVRDITPETGFSGSGTGFTFDRDARRIILPSPRRLFRSDNGGSQWSPLDLTSEYEDYRPETAGSYFVRQDPKNPQVLYAVMSLVGTVARSDDFGSSWTKLGEDQFRQFADVAVHETFSNVVLALRKISDDYEGPAMWISQDGGESFTPQWDSGLPHEFFDWDTDAFCIPFYSSMATTPVQPEVVYVAQTLGIDEYCPATIHKSTDGGLSFTPLEFPGFAPIQVFTHPTRADVLYVQVANPFHSSIYRSMDGGASFELLDGGLPNQNFFVSFDRRNPDHVYVAGVHGVFLSTNDGETFQALGLSAEQLGSFATNVNVDPKNSRVIYVNTFNGNFKSSNGGLNFQPINSGWRALFIADIALDNAANPSLYLATDHGLMRTRTRGHDYQIVPGPAELADTRKLAIAPSNPDVIIASTNSGNIYRTIDGGKSWVLSSVDPGPALPDDIAIDPQYSNVMYFQNPRIDIFEVVTTPGIFKSVDTGANFALTADTSFSTVEIDPINTNIIYGAIACGGCPYPLSRSINGGLDFSVIPGAQLFSNAQAFEIVINPINTQNIFVGGELSLFDDPWVSHSILRSRDGGASFTGASFGLPLGVTFVMSPDNPSRLYYWSTETGLFLTDDAGDNWKSVPIAELTKLTHEAYTTDLLINPRHPTLLYVMGNWLLEVELH